MIEFCTKYHCTTTEIGRVLKASVLDRKTSPYHRNMEGEFSAERLIEKIKKAEGYTQNEDKSFSKYTSDETKEVLYSIFGGYVETLKEFLEHEPKIRERVIVG